MQPKLFSQFHYRLSDIDHIGFGNILDVLSKKKRALPEKQSFIIYVNINNICRI